MLPVCYPNISFSVCRTHKMQSLMQTKRHRQTEKMQRRKRRQTKAQVVCLIH